MVFENCSLKLQSSYFLFALYQNIPFMIFDACWTVIGTETEIYYHTQISSCFALNSFLCKYTIKVQTSQAATENILKTSTMCFCDFQISIFSIIGHLAWY